MKQVIYRDEEFDDEIFVEEMTLKEAIEYAVDWYNGLKEMPEGYANMYMYIEYKDGSIYSNSDGDEDGRFKKTGIKSMVLDDGYEYYIYGKYTMNENLIPELF